MIHYFIINRFFTYDNLDRLTAVAGTNYTQQISYSPNGNIISKTDVGIYDYSATQPHAVSVINTPTAELQNLPQQDITYIAFNKTAQISEGNYQLTFTYGPDYQRKISELKNNGNTERKIIYVGDYEKIITPTDVYHVNYIAATDGLTAIAVKQNGGPMQLYYVHTDHLGSILALYDKNGQKIYEQSFDAWGRERNPNDWTYTANPNIKPAWLIRGYTGHEHHKEFGLINMNGRMYDPVIGRMLSADNFVQAWDFTQTYNRYTYGLNNPLVYTDPSGEAIPFAVLMIAYAAGVGAVQGHIIASQRGATGWEMVGYIAGGAAIGAAAGVGGWAGGLAGGVLYSYTGITGGFAMGAVTGTTGGLVGGFVEGAGMSWLGGANFEQGLNAGLRAGAIGGIIGGILGGLSAGFESLQSGKSFWTGDVVPFSEQWEAFKGTYLEEIKKEFGEDLYQNIKLRPKPLRIYGKTKPMRRKPLGESAEYPGAQRYRSIIKISQRVVREWYRSGGLIGEGEPTLYHEFFHAMDFYTGADEYYTMKAEEYLYQNQIFDVLPGPYSEYRAYSYEYYKFQTQLSWKRILELREIFIPLR
jgi:RHS repeat-associated protein